MTKRMARMERASSSPDLKREVRDALSDRLYKFRGRMPHGFRFDRDEAHERSDMDKAHLPLAPGMPIPTRADWGVVDKNDLDAKWAFDTFLGVSFDSAVGLFRSNALFYQEDLQSMPPVPFRYYAPALVAYLLSGDAKGDADGASSFLHLLIELLDRSPALLRDDVGRVLFDAAGRIAASQGFYAADEGIYGRFEDLHARVLALIALPPATD